MLQRPASSRFPHLGAALQEPERRPGTTFSSWFSARNTSSQRTPVLSGSPAGRSVHMKNLLEGPLRAGSPAPPREASQVGV